MSSPQEAFSAAVATFIESSNREEQIRAEQWLMEWQRNPNSLPLALEVIESSLNLNDIFFSALAVNFIINNFADQFNSETLDRTFLVLKNRFVSSTPNTLDEKCKNCLAKDLACISAIYPEYMDKNWTDCNIDDMILYFTFLAECLGNDNKVFDDKLTHENTINFLIKLLSQAQQLTPTWVDLMKFVAQQIDGVKFDSSVIWGFLPFLREVPNQLPLYSNFLELYQEIAIDADSIGFSDDFRIIQEFMMILVNMVDKLLNGNADEIQAAQFASVAWCEIIDYNVEFFLACSDEFLSALLQKFLITLRFLIIDPNEFLEVAKTSKYNINAIVRNNNNFFPVIFQFLDIIMFAINTNYDEFINDETNRNIISKIIRKLTEIPYESDFQSSPLCQYFTEKLKEFSDGLIFVIASTFIHINQYFAPAVAQQILASDSVPQSALQFIRLSTINVGPKYKSGIISLVYSSFINSPNIAAIQAICEFTLQDPQVFIDNAQKLMTPLISWLQQSPPQLIPYIMSSLLYLLARIEPNSENSSQFEQILSIISKVVCEQTSSLLQNEVLSMFSFIYEIVNTVIIIKNDLEIENNIIKQFFYQVFNQFIIILEPLWHFQSDQIMSSLCKFLSDSIEAKIVQDYSQIIKWIGEALYIAPVQDHIKLLSKQPIYQLLTDSNYKQQIEPIMRFVVSFPQIEDAELRREVYLFIFELFNLKWPGFLDVFSVELLLSPLTSIDNRITEVAILLVNQLIIQNYFNDIRPILTMLVNGMFTNFQEISIKNSMNTLINAIKYGRVTADQVLELFSNQVDFNSNEVREFQIALSSPKSPEEFDETRIFKCAKKLVFLYHKPLNEVPT